MELFTKSATALSVGAVMSDGLLPTIWCDEWKNLKGAFAPPFRVSSETSLLSSIRACLSEKLFP